MKTSHKIISLVTLVIFITGCAGMTVRQQDLDSWVGVPVEKLDTHSFFLTLPLVKTITDSGVEIRVYPNKKNITNCFDTGNIKRKSYSKSANFNAFQNCNSQIVGCDNIFYIKDKKVLEYKPVGRCRTAASLQPERKNY